jgi:hypothetical protein
MLLNPPCICEFTEWVDGKWFSHPKSLQNGRILTSNSAFLLPFDRSMFGAYYKGRNCLETLKIPSRLVLYYTYKFFI